MNFWQGFITGLLSGVLASLLAGNSNMRFYVEAFVRRRLGRPLVSVKLVSFTHYCRDGLLLVHAIELRSCMWFTPSIPRVYLLSRGAIDYDAHAYKPFVYFRSRGLSQDKLDYTPSEAMAECGSKVVPYSPDDPSLSLTISRTVPIRIAFICEAIDLQGRHVETPMNHLKVVGKLHAAVANPMPEVKPGSWWNTSIVSEEFGFIDGLHVTVPEDLLDREPLGDRADVLDTPNRPACLMVLDFGGYNWPVRFIVNDCELVVKKNYPRKVEVRKPDKERRQRRRGTLSAHRKRTKLPDEGIKIQ